MGALFMILASLSFLAGVVCSLVAAVGYMRTPGASLFGWGYTRYFYGTLRKEKPALFYGTFGGIAGGLIFQFVAIALTG